MLYDIEAVKNHTESSSYYFDISTLINQDELFEKLFVVCVALSFGYYTGQKNNSNVSHGERAVVFNSENNSEETKEATTPQFR